MSNLGHESGEYPLPILKSDTVHGLVGSFEDLGPNEAFRVAFERMDRANPVLGKAVKNFAETQLRLKDEREIQIAYRILVITHELLLKQAEVDGLNQHLA